VRGSVLTEGELRAGRDGDRFVNLCVDGSVGRPHRILWTESGENVREVFVEEGNR
jgi:hypothetical protein